jgi:hypothetical protein
MGVSPWYAKHPMIGVPKGRHDGSKCLRISGTFISSLQDFGNGCYQIHGLSPMAKACRRFTVRRMGNRIHSRGPFQSYRSKLFMPSVDHQIQESKTDTPREWRTTRIAIDGVVVRFVDDSNYLTIIAEGELESERLKSIVDEPKNGCLAPGYGSLDLSKHCGSH